MINWLRGKLKLQHNCYVNVKKLFEHVEFGNPLYCSICNRKIK